MPKDTGMSAKEKRSLRSGLFGGMSKRELEQVKQCARERQTSYSSFEDRMIDAVCFTCPEVVPHLSRSACARECACVPAESHSWLLCAVARTVCVRVCVPGFEAASSRRFFLYTASPSRA